VICFKCCKNAKLETLLFLPGNVKRKKLTKIFFSAKEMHVVCKTRHLNANRINEKQRKVQENTTKNFERSICFVFHE
jgi:hypothetical protein